MDIANVCTVAEITESYLIGNSGQNKPNDDDHTTIKGASGNANSDTHKVTYTGFDIDA